MVPRPGTVPADATGMTAPRQVLPATTYLVTRRCAQRQFLLRPSSTTNDVFRYLLAVASQRFQIQVHVYCVLSNHFHLVVTDPDARLPAFGQYLDALVARAVNASLGRWESFWAPSSYSAVALQSPADVIDKIAYALANPVAAGLVARARDWPGLWTDPEAIGGCPLVAKRPSKFFRRSGYLPEEVELALVVPPGFSSAAEFRDQLRSALAELEQRARCDVSSSGRGFLGEAKVLGQDPRRRPVAGEPRRTLKPRVASRDKWKRIEALLRLVEFLRQYRLAWSALRSGERDAVFPAGTYLLRVRHGVRCAGFA